MSSSTLVLRFHIDLVVNHLAINCSLNDHAAHFPGSKVLRFELEESVRVVLADLSVRDRVVDFDSAILTNPIVAIGPAVIPSDLQVSENVCELWMRLVDPSFIVVVAHIFGK